MELTVTRELHPDQLPTIHAVLDAATSHDGIAPLSEQFLRGLTNPQHHHFLLYDDTTIVGIAAYDGETAELAVTPTARRHGGATLLIDLMGHKPLWAHGNLQPAQHFARHLGYTPSRELLVMAIDGDPLTAATAYQFPDGVELLDLPTAYDRYGSETVDQLWLEANNQAFSWHPEQGGWDLDRLNQARDTDWYRPDDVLTLWENSKLLGFHWVKRHGDLRAGAKGEVYVVGLGDAGRGRGLGGPLVNAGINRLVAEGASLVFLYVEADNEPALRAYQDVGFVVVEHHVLYTRS